MRRLFLVCLATVASVALAFDKAMFDALWRDALPYTEITGARTVEDMSGILHSYDRETGIWSPEFGDGDSEHANEVVATYAMKAADANERVDMLQLEYSNLWAAVEVIGVALSEEEPNTVVAPGTNPVTVEGDEANIEVKQPIIDFSGFRKTDYGVDGPPNEPESGPFNGYWTSETRVSDVVNNTGDLLYQYGEWFKHLHDMKLWPKNSLNSIWLIRDIAFTGGQLRVKGVDGVAFMEENGVVNFDDPSDKVLYEAEIPAVLVSEDATNRLAVTLEKVGGSGDDDPPAVLAKMVVVGLDESVSNTVEFANVAFSGDYDDLVNLPEYKFEEDDSGEGGETKVVLVVKTEKTLSTNDVGLARIAKTGKWGDLNGIPVGTVTAGDQIKCEDGELYKRGVDISINTNGLEWTTNAWEEVCSFAPGEWFKGSVDVLESATSTTNGMMLTFCKVKLSQTNGLERADSENESITIEFPKCTCDPSGGDGGGSDGTYTCDCEIKTTDDLPPEEDPIFTQWRDGAFDDWKTWVDNQINTMAQKVVSLEQWMGKVPINPRYPGSTPGLDE